MFTKLTALLAVMALMVGLSFGIKDMTGASALAEEAFPPVAETETRLQDAGEEIISRETEEEIVPQGSEKEIIPQEPEEEIVPQEPEEEIVPQEPEEETVPQEPEEETIPQEPEEETVPQEPEEETAPQEPEEEIIPQEPEEKTVPQEPQEEIVPQDAKDAGQAADDKPAGAPEAETDPEDEAKPELPEDPGDEDEPDTDESWNEEDLVEMEDGDAGYISEEITGQLDYPEQPEQTDRIGTAEIRLMNEGMLNYGDEVVLKAEVRDVNLSYRLVWEANDGAGWYPVGHDETYRFILDRNSAEREYRVTIIACD